MLNIKLDQSKYMLAHSELVGDLSSFISSSVANKFSATSLDELNSMAMDNRIDSKFLLPKSLLADVLNHLSGNYAILTVGNESIFTYENTYFDTPDRFFYKSHHNGKLNRQKLRFRRYKESGVCVLETKLKNNKSRTIKERISIYQDNQNDINSFVNQHIHSTKGSLSPKLFNNYHRMTFVHLHNNEKVTVDFNLSFENPDNNLSYHIDDYFVVEVKAKDKVYRSEFATYCKANGIRKKRFSKYCMGTCLTNDHALKKNNFKKELSLFGN